MSALARKWWWRGVFAATGGMTVRGRLPVGPCVVVANHSSHADAAAMLAAMPARSRPVVAAAADYWFGSRVRAVICRRLVAGFAVKRHGGGSADLASASSWLAAGGSVVVFPEGSRSRTGELGAFHSGATRLAATAGVPIVPVALVGTNRLLPVHGRPHLGHVEVRVGAPLRGVDAEAARSAVAALATSPALSADSRVRVAVERFTATRGALVVIAMWACAEALSWPLVPELALGLLLLARPRGRRAVTLTATAALASAAGCLLAYALAAGGHPAPAPLTTPRMHAVAMAQLADEGAAGLAHQPWSGIPVKVYAVAAGDQRVDLPEFALQVVVARSARLVTVALAVSGVSMLLPRRAYAAVACFALAAFAIGLARVVSIWS